MTAPDNWIIDSAPVARPSVDETMLDLLYDIKSNHATIASAREFFGKHQRQVMIAIGVNGPLFPGETMKPLPSVPDIEFHAIESGHFALEHKCEEIGRLTSSFLAQTINA